MKNIKWESSVASHELAKFAKDENAGKAKHEIADAHVEKLYIDQMEKGGFSIARLSEDETHAGRLECELWLKTSLWADKVENSHGEDRVGVSYNIVNGSADEDPAVFCFDGTHFRRFDDKELFAVQNYFKERKLDKLSESDLIAELKDCVLDAYKKMGVTVQSA